MLFIQFDNQFFIILQSALTYLSFAAASELFAVTATYPYRLLRTRMQDLHHQRVGTLQMFLRTLR